MHFSMFNSVNSGQWIQDPVANFIDFYATTDGLYAFGHTIVGESTLVAAGGYSGSFYEFIHLLQPNTGRTRLSSRLPTPVGWSCSIAINPTSKLGEN